MHCLDSPPVSHNSQENSKHNFNAEILAWKGYIVLIYEQIFIIYSSFGITTKKNSLLVGYIVLINLQILTMHSNSKQ